MPLYLDNAKLAAVLATRKDLTAVEPALAMLAQLGIVLETDDDPDLYLTVATILGVTREAAKRLCLKAAYGADDLPYWVIASGSEPVRYWCGRLLNSTMARHGFTEDVTKAVRFAREFDAEMFRIQNLDEEVSQLCRARQVVP